MQQWRGWTAAITVAAVAAAGLLRAGESVPAHGAPAPEIQAQQWLNAKPLSRASLRGKVVAVEFWTYG
jgi:hypothetical protein